MVTPGQPTVAQIGKGTQLAFAAAGTSPTFAPIAELLAIKLPKHQGETIEIQRYDSPTIFGELITSWAKAGELEFTLVYSAAQAAALWALFMVPGQFQLTKPDTKTWTYQGIITEFGDEVPLKDKMTVQAKFAISGAPVPGTTSA